MLTKEDLDQIRGAVRKEVTAAENRLNGRMNSLDGRMDTLDGKVDTLTGRIDTLELKVEAFHSEQRQANDEIMGHLMTSNDVNGKEQQALEKRVERIETYLNLPRVK